MNRGNVLESLFASDTVGQKYGNLFTVSENNNFKKMIENERILIFFLIIFQSGLAFFTTVQKLLYIRALKYIFQNKTIFIRTATVIV